MANVVLYLIKYLKQGPVELNISCRLIIQLTVTLLISDYQQVVSKNAIHLFQICIVSYWWHCYEQKIFLLSSVRSKAHKEQKMNCFVYVWTTEAAVFFGLPVCSGVQHQIGIWWKLWHTWPEYWKQNQGWSENAMTVMAWNNHDSTHLIRLLTPLERFFSSSWLMNWKTLTS